MTNTQQTNSRTVHYDHGTYRYSYAITETSEGFLLSTYSAQMIEGEAFNEADCGSDTYPTLDAATEAGEGFLSDAD